MASPERARYSAADGTERLEGRFEHGVHKASPAVLAYGPGHTPAGAAQAAANQDRASPNALEANADADDLAVGQRVAGFTVDWPA